MSEDNAVLQDKFFLAIPYAEKDQAKRELGRLPSGDFALGFDKQQNLWFAKAGTHVEKIKSWQADPQQFSSPSSSDPITEFAMVMTGAGLHLLEPPILDGKVHRVKTLDDKGSQRSGAYAGYSDGHPTGWYQDHRNHTEPQKWSASFQQADPLAKLHIKAHLANREYQRQQQESKKHQHHAKRCAQVFQLMPSANADHPYLKRKDARVFPDVGQDKQGRLVIPLMDEHHKIHSLQRISNNSFKCLKKGAQKSGHFFVVGYKPLQNGEPILYAEGYATAASIAEATNRSVVMTVDAGNMPKVATKLSQHYPDSQHLFLADDDRKNAINKGVEKAQQAAKITNGHWLTPHFISDQIAYGMTDFNDLAMSSGNYIVKEQIEGFIKKCWPQVLPKRPEQLTTPNNSIQPYTPQPEATENKSSGSTAKSATKSKAEIPIKPILPTTVKHYSHVDNRYYFAKPPRRLAFVDKGNKLQTQLVHTQVIKDLLTIAAQRNWNKVKLSGSKAFKREAWFQAQCQGLKVRGYRPDEKDRIRLAQVKQSQAENPKAQSSQFTQNPNRNQQTPKQPETPIQAAQEYCQHLEPQAQQQFMAKVKQRLGYERPKSPTQVTPPENIIQPVKEATHEHELER